MLVHYILRVVPPGGGHTSYKPGRTVVDHHDDAEKAQVMADRFNAHRNLHTFEYVVEPHDEMEVGWYDRVAMRT